MGEVGAPPERIRLVGTVERVNRQAAAVGQNGKISAAKAVIQLKKVNENHWQLWVSVVNDLDGQRYDIDHVERLRTNFIKDGKLTIEFRQPPFSVMLRNCKPPELDALVERIKLIKKSDSRLKSVADCIEEKAKMKISNNPSPGSKVSKEQPGCTSKSKSANDITPKTGQNCPASSSKIVRGNSGSALFGAARKIISVGTGAGTANAGKSPNTVGSVANKGSSSSPGCSLKVIQGGSQTLGAKKEKTFEYIVPEELKPVRHGVKRPLASLDMSKTEASAIRKSLKLASGSLVISDRSDYPLRGFPADLKRLTCNNLLLRKIDYRLQDLLHLKVISMPGNKVSSIDMLAHMKSQLENLNFANNQITGIGEDVFRSKAFSRLKILNLNGNQLRCLPNSILALPELMELHLSNNSIQVLPYNLHRLNTLVLLKLNGNRLTALPSPISLMNLNYLDISANQFPHKDVLANAKGKVQLEHTTTLFEKAGAALLSHQLCRRTNISFRYDLSVMPKIISDFLARAKYCRQCGNMCLRYMISYQYSSQSLAQEFVRHTREFPVCLIRCDKCSRSEF